MKRLDFKPDFRVPIAWRDVTEEHLSRTTVSRDWYEKRIPGLNEDTMLWFYGFTGEVKEVAK